MDTWIDGGIVVLTIAMVIIPSVKNIKKLPASIIPTKKPKRQTKKPSFWESLTISGRLFVIIGVILIALTILSIDRKRQSEKALTEKIDSLSQNLESQSKNISALKIMIDSLSGDPADKVNSGFSLASILKVGNVLDRRLKYIFDCGEDLSHNRVSLFLDYENNLILSVIDNSGVVYSVRATPHFVTFKPNAFYFLYCDVGYSDKYSFLRIFLDDRLVGQQTFENKIDGEKLKLQNFKIGSDLLGNNNGAFDLSELAVWERPLSRKQIIDIMNGMIPK